MTSAVLSFPRDPREDHEFFSKQHPLTGTATIQASGKTISVPRHGYDCNPFLVLGTADYELAKRALGDDPTVEPAAVYVDGKKMAQVRLWLGSGEGNTGSASLIGVTIDVAPKDSPAITWANPSNKMNAMVSLIKGTTNQFVGLTDTSATDTGFFKEIAKIPAEVGSIGVRDNGKTTEFDVQDRNGDQVLRAKLTNLSVRDTARNSWSLYRASGLSRKQFALGAASNEMTVPLRQPKTGEPWQEALQGRPHFRPFNKEKDSIEIGDGVIGGNPQLTPLLKDWTQHPRVIVQLRHMKDAFEPVVFDPNLSGGASRP